MKQSIVSVIVLAESAIILRELAHIIALASARESCGHQSKTMTMMMNLRSIYDRPESLSILFALCKHIQRVVDAHKSIICIHLEVLPWKVAIGL